MVESRFAAPLHTLEQKFRDGDPHADVKSAEAGNIATLHKVVIAIGQDDFDTVSELLSPDSKIDIYGGEQLPFIRRTRGHAESLDAIKKNFASVKDQRPEIQSVVAQGDTVILFVKEEGLIRATGQAYKINGVLRYVFREGKVDHVEEFIVQDWN